jgi:hypothetical protein
VSKRIGGAPSLTSLTNSSFSNVRQGAIYNDEGKRQAAFRWLADKAVLGSGYRCRPSSSRHRRRLHDLALKNDHRGVIHSQEVLVSLAGGARAVMALVSTPVL